MQLIVHKRKWVILHVLLFLSIVAFQVSGQQLNTIVKTNDGYIGGSVENGILVFKGIPYAAPPVGASGSWTSTAKLLVPAGGSVHSSAGETFSPLQPKELKTNFSAIGPCAEISGLFNSKALA